MVKFQATFIPITITIREVTQLQREVCILILSHSLEARAKDKGIGKIKSYHTFHIFNRESDLKIYEIINYDFNKLFIFFYY